MDTAGWILHAALKLSSGRLCLPGGGEGGREGTATGDPFKPSAYLSGASSSPYSPLSRRKEIRASVASCSADSFVLFAVELLKFSYRVYVFDGNDEHELCV